MKAMTPEQNKQWMQALNPLDYLDFHATTAKGIKESTDRLAGLGVPGFASRTRASLISWQIGNPQKEALWLPEFALRSEVAMAGLQVLYPNQAEGALVYRRVLKLLLHDALLPFAIWPEIEQLCQVWSTETLEEKWGEAQQAVVEVAVDSSKVDWKGKRKDYKRIQHAIETCRLLEIVGVVDSWEPKEWWKGAGYDLGHRLLVIYGNNLNRFLRGQQRKTLRLSGRAKLLSDLFLAALEAKCPPPDWLPRA